MIRDLILRNFWLKLFSLVLATLIWLAVAYNVGFQLPTGGRGLGATREFPHLPVWVLGPAGDREGVVIEPGHVTVRISGAPAAVQALRPEELRAFVHLEPERGFSGAFAVEVVAPRGFVVLSVTPSGVTVRAPENL